MNFGLCHWIRSQEKACLINEDGFDFLKVEGVDSGGDGDWEIVQIVNTLNQETLVELFEPCYNESKCESVDESWYLDGLSQTELENQVKSQIELLVVTSA